MFTIYSWITFNRWKQQVISCPGSASQNSLKHPGQTLASAAAAAAVTTGFNTRNTETGHVIVRSKQKLSQTALSFAKANIESALRNRKVMARRKVEKYWKANETWGIPRFAVHKLGWESLLTGEEGSKLSGSRRKKTQLTPSKVNNA